ncbi:MAG: hypothetical protein GY835_05840 [bacterium]|nr:hypothetical protein [bacterium]
MQVKHIVVCVFIILSVAEAGFTQVIWDKHPGNPVFGPGAAGEWDERNVYAPHVIFHENEYWLYYVGKNLSNDVGIGLAISTDGVQWERTGRVLDQGSLNDWDLNMGDPFVLVWDSQFWMWYQGISNSNEKLIGLATSIDGLNWTKYGPVLNRSENGWDSSWLGGPCVLTVNDHLEMWYDGGDGSPPKLGLALSEDGINWSKYDDNPVMDGTLWDQGVGDSHILKIGPLYHMWYQGNSPEPSTYQVGYAYSDDGIHWSKRDDNPVLPLGPTGAWDELHTSDPSVLYVNSELRMWYDGFDGSNWRIGFATSTLNIPYILNVQASQHPSPSMYFDISYDLYRFDGMLNVVDIQISDDNGQTWNVIPTNAVGDIGPGISPGPDKLIIWNAGLDYPNIINDQMRVRVIADDGR